ncbi:MAG: gliding motility protein [Candidatus Acidiferrum sp.]
MESTQELILSLFPPAERSNSSLLRLAQKAEALTAASTLPQRLDAFVDLYSWTRERDVLISDPLASAPCAAAEAPDPDSKRSLVWTSILESSPEILAQYRQSVAQILRETDGLTFFASSGLPSDRGLLAETSERFSRIVLPSPREDTDLSKLFLRMFPTDKDVDRFFNTLPEHFDRIVSLAAPPDDSDAWPPMVETLLDAFCLLGARIQGLGLSEELRMRSRTDSPQQSPFYRLTRSGDSLVSAVKTNEGLALAEKGLKQTVADCRAELQSIATNLDSNGVNLDVVYVLDVIRHSLLRIEAIAAVLAAEPGPAKKTAVQHLLTDVVRGRLADRSLRHLAHNNLRLLARKITEWAGKTGEHYITTDRSEYWLMWRAALGGGLLTVATAGIKMVVTHSDLPLFFEGFLSGLNYSISFILLQVFSLVLATKQPSMTGAALARIVHRCRDASRSDELVTFVARIFRSQLAAALGNVVAVSLGALAFSFAWRAAIGSPFIPEETAQHTVESLNPFHSGTILFAALTGVILWLSSLAGGWIENWAVYNRLPQAIAEHRLGGLLQRQTLIRISDVFTRNISGWGGSIALGFMLGMTPPLARFFGVPLDVRHVTLSTGTLALSSASLGHESLDHGDLYWAALGIAFTFVLNLTVSFYFALRLALRAQDVTSKDHLQIMRSLVHRFAESPREFFLPPADVAGTVVSTH